MKSCCCSPHDLPTQDFQRPPCSVNTCPECGKSGKRVAGQTVKSLLSVSLRQVQDIKYLFCRTQNCPVVYFSTDGEQVFVIGEIRERVYQKEPEAEDVFVCYCFQYALGDLHSASPKERSAILDDINAGINAGQCVCDLRNPQGSCCLGNVRSLVKSFEVAITASST